MPGSPRGARGRGGEVGGGGRGWSRSGAGRKGRKPEKLKIQRALPAQGEGNGEQSFQKNKQGRETRGCESRGVCVCVCGSPVCTPGGGVRCPVGEQVCRVSCASLSAGATCGDKGPQRQAHICTAGCSCDQQLTTCVTAGTDPAGLCTPAERGSPRVAACQPAGVWTWSGCRGSHDCASLWMRFLYGPVTRW